MKRIKSIIQLDRDRCFFPSCPNMPTDVHHVMHGPDRSKAEEDGLFIFVCRECHDLIHFDKDRSGQTDRALKRLAQLKWEERWKTKNTTQVTLKSVKEVEDYMEEQAKRARLAWMARYGRNYL